MPPSGFGGPPGLGFGGGVPSFAPMPGVRQGSVTPEDEQIALTELAAQDLARQRGVNDPSQVIRQSGDTAMAEMMRDQALQEYLQRKQQMERQRQLAAERQPQWPAPRQAVAPAPQDDADAWDGDGDGWDGGEDPQEVLSHIRGLGPAKVDALLTEFPSLDAIRDASVAELTTVPGIGKALAAEISRALR